LSGKRTRSLFFSKEVSLIRCVHPTHLWGKSGTFTYIKKERRCGTSFKERGGGGGEGGEGEDSHGRVLLILNSIREIREVY